MKLIHRLLDDYAFEGIKGQKSDLKPNHSVQSPTHSSPTMKLTKKKRVFSSINQFWRCSNIQNKNTDYFSKHRIFYRNFKRDEICQDLLIFAFDLKEKNVIA